jgi:glycosyltransferase involved in cell wall biosynthesis
MSHPVRIGVDMAATAGQKSGLGFYVENLVTKMDRLSGPHTLVKIETIQKNLRTPMRLLWDQVGLPLVASRKNLDVLFVPAFSAPRFSKPIVMTAHDIYGVLHPEQFSVAARHYWTRVLPNSMRRAERLLCISEHTKKDLILHLGIEENRLTVIPLAAAEAFRIMDNPQWVAAQLKTLKINAPFILSVGTLEPRKNFERLIEAYAFSQRKDVKLVLVGKKGWEYHGIFEKIRKYHLQDAVMIVDYVTEDQLVALYNACLFFVMPSVYEGFGLPALEAMQCGAPVAAAHNTSIPEVVGEAGVLFDPYDVSNIRERLDLLLTNYTLRHTMQRKSHARSKQFSWEKTARATLREILQISRTQ